MNLVLFLLLMITCFLDGPFVIIFNLGLGFPTLLMILCILLIFLACNLGKVSLIFKFSLVIGNDAWVYDLLMSLFSNGLVSFLKNLEISLTFLGVFIGISSRSFAKLTGLSVSLLSLVDFLVFWIFSINLDATCCLNVLLSLLVTRVSQSDSYIIEMKF